MNASRQKKLLADRVWDEIWHWGDLSRMSNLFTQDFVRHDPGRELHGIEQNRQFISDFRAAFPDLHYTVEDQIAEGNKVVVRYHFRVPAWAIFKDCQQHRKRGILIHSIVLLITRSQNNGQNLISWDFSNS